jgi:predicted nucleic acid-binding protein
VNLLDSSAWLEFFADGPLAGKFSAIASEPESVLVPTVILYEVFKVVMRERGETEALQAVAALRQGKVVDINEETALLAARASLAHKLPMADSLILATASLHDATIWTMDEHFKDLPQVRYFSSRS